MAATSEVEMASTSTQIILSDRVLKVPSCQVGSGVTAVLLQQSDLRQVLHLEHLGCPPHRVHWQWTSECKKPHWENFMGFAASQRSRNSSLPTAHVTGHAPNLPKGAKERRSSRAALK